MSKRALVPKDNNTCVKVDKYICPLHSPSHSPLTPSHSKKKEI